MNKTSILLYICLGLLLAGCSESTPNTYPYNYTIMTDTVSILSTPTMTPIPPEDSTPTMNPTPTDEPTPTEIQGEPVKITIVYNNIPGDPRLTADLGFGAYIEYHDSVILFDTGTSGQILLKNMQILNIDPTSIQAVVLSHSDDDHVGGLADFLEVSSHPPVYLLSVFGDYFIEKTQQSTQVIEAVPGQEIAADIITSGEIAGNPPEQSLAIHTRKGLVVVTGCAHPGIVRIVERVIELTGEPVYMVMGGFHLGNANEGQIRDILADLRRLGVQVVAPSHCTGELATRMFAAEYGEDFISTGVGSVITIDNYVITIDN